jgi:hypothetical protein
MNDFFFYLFPKKKIKKQTKLHLPLKLNIAAVSFARPKNNNTSKIPSNKPQTTIRMAEKKEKIEGSTMRNRYEA